MSSMEKNPIRDDKFWADRLNDAEKAGDLRLSVYLAGQDMWQRIEKDHSRIIKEHIKPEDKVLDAGCGYGRLAPLFDPTKYVGVDLSKALIRKAKNLYPNYEFLQQDLTALPFQEQEFDWAVMVSMEGMVIRELGDAAWLEIIVEVARVAKKILILEYGSSDEIKIVRSHLNNDEDSTD